MAAYHITFHYRERITENRTIVVVVDVFERFTAAYAVVVDVLS